MNSFILEIIILSVTSYIYGYQIKENIMNEECSKNRRNYKLMRNFRRKSERWYITP
jgi:hypothetical protein